MCLLGFELEFVNCESSVLYTKPLGVRKKYLQQNITIIISQGIIAQGINIARNIIELQYISVVNC